MKSRFHIMSDYLDDLVIYIVPYRRLYGSCILCVRGVILRRIAQAFSSTSKNHHPAKSSSMAE